MKRTYEDLKREVWETGRCSGCGACVAVCPANAIIFREGSPDAHPVHTGYCKEATDGVPCGACYGACPRTDERRAAAGDLPLLGDYLDLLSARATFEIERKQSGGAVTAILKNALEEDLIDAVVTVGEDKWTMKPFSTLITSSGELIHHAGSRYNWWVPTLAILKEAVVRRKYRRIAVIGVPCVVSAINAMRESDNDLLRPYARAVRLVIGLFCTESFDYRKLIEDTLGGVYGIKPWQIRRLNVKGALEVSGVGGLLHSIPLRDLEACIRPGCLHCTDFSAVYADISAGAVGSPDGYTTLIIRNSVGRGFVERALQNGLLEEGENPSLAPIERLAAKKAQRIP
ncbi:MAG: Coenzyme F420 hydrogenase/dehydrogenase, beta subunit C-terminal domain [Methanomicrobiaceae archaeon]|nr:Coenzyme F420 hydrogenase/dehydrogenase, beta subunit C-terminal domain [Methanomicrobiaceae archaeon]